MKRRGEEPQRISFEEEVREEHLLKVQVLNL